MTGWELFPVAGPTAAWLACHLAHDRLTRRTPSKAVAARHDSAPPAVRAAICQACETAPAVVNASFGSTTPDGDTAALCLHVDLDLCWVCLTPGASAATAVHPLSHATSSATH